MTIILGVFIVALGIVCFLQHRAIGALRANADHDRDEAHIATLDTRQQAASLVRDLRRDHQAKTADLYSYLATQLAARDRTLADQAEILRGIVAFLDDVPQNFEFSRAGIHYKMVLPDRLKMSLTRDGS